MKWYLEVLRNYAVFEGRARRKEYWMFLLLHTLFAVGLAFIDGLTGTFDEEVGVGALSGLYLLALALPALAVNVRRLHDRGRSGWYVLLVLVPLLGTIPFLVFMCQDSAPGSNQYGANPKGVIS
jgi:uncharacterized membrane protein YhaH (DUF805 family)